MMDCNYTYRGNHFTIYANQIIILYILNLYSAVCPLYLNKIGEKELNTVFFFKWLICEELMGDLSTGS